MPLGMHQDCRERLVRALIGALTNARVRAGALVETESLNEIRKIETLPKQGPVQQKLLKYIGDDALFRFVEGELSSSFTSCHVKDLSAVALSEHPGFEDIEALATRLVEALEGLPREYAGTIRLPRALGKEFVDRIGAIRLSDASRIARGQDLVGEFPIAPRKSGLGLVFFAADQVPEWTSEDAYFQVQVEGYLSKTGETETLHLAKDQALGVLGLALAFDLFDPHGFVAPWEGPSTPTSFVMHEKRGGQWESRSGQAVEQRYEDILRCARFNPPTWTEPPAYTGWMRYTLETRIGSIIRSDQGGNLILAARWLLDSYTGNDAMLKFVQATVAAEILLGDAKPNEEVGLTVLMANRCAYLIGRTNDQRLELMKTFREIYDVRSKIVHTGKRRLSEREDWLLHRLRWICKRVIMSEQELIERDERIGQKLPQPG